MRVRLRRDFVPSPCAGAATAGPAWSGPTTRPSPNGRWYAIVGPVGPEDTALYSCSCGYQFDAPVSASVQCPHCGQGIAW